MAKRGYQTVALYVGKKKKGNPKLYTNQQVVAARDHVIERLESGPNRLFYVGKLDVLLEAVFKHGQKLGARKVFEEIENVKKSIPHRLPGRPRRD